MFCCNEENLCLPLAAAEALGLSIKPERPWLHPSRGRESQGQLEVTGHQQQKPRVVNTAWEEFMGGRRAARRLDGRRSGARLRQERYSDRTGPPGKERLQGHFLTSCFFTQVSREGEGLTGQPGPPDES